jgi:hypothetical protein
MPSPSRRILAALFLCVLAGSWGRLGEADDNVQNGTDGESERKILEVRIAKLVNELDDPQFQTRQHATAELTRIGLPALPALNKKLADKPPLDVRTRIERIIETVELRQAPEFQLHAEWQVDTSFFALSPGGKWLAAGAGRIYDVDNKRELTFDSKTAAQGLPAFSFGDGYWAYSEKPANGKLAIRVYDRKQGKETTRAIRIKGAADRAACVRALSPSGRYAVLDAPDEEDSASLVDLTTGAETARFQASFNVYSGDSRTKLYRVRFTPDEKHLFIHVRSSDWSGFTIWDIEKGQRKANLHTWVSWETDRFAASSDGKFLVNGDFRYDITRLELSEGTKTVLFKCREELYSHWLEMLLSPNDRMLAVWSSERAPIIFFDLASQERFQIDRKRATSFRREMLAFSRDGRYAFLARDQGLDVVDLKYRKVARSMGEPYDSLADDRGIQMSADGRCLVVRQTPKDGGHSKLRIFKERP